MKPSSPILFKRLEQLERELQRLKVTASLALPRGPRPRPPYTEAAIRRAAEDLRDEIWQTRYAQKVAGLR